MTVADMPESSESEDTVAGRMEQMTTDEPFSMEASDDPYATSEFDFGLGVDIGFGDLFADPQSFEEFDFE